MSLDFRVGWTQADLRDLCYSKSLTERIFGWILKTILEAGTTAVVALLLTYPFFSLVNHLFSINFQMVADQQTKSLLHIYGFVTLAAWNVLSCFTTSEPVPEEREGEENETTDQETKGEEQKTMEGTSTEREPVEKEA